MTTSNRTTVQQVQLLNVTRAFGDTVALDDFSLDIPGGQFVALLGPSGSGKSTALNCLAGLLRLTSGEIRVDGARVDGLPPERRGFGMVFQNYALFPHKTVADNVAFGLKMRKVGKSQVDDRVRECLDLVQLAGHPQKYPNQLSGGERQRVAIARAVAFQPPVVLMDEPLSNLDAKLRLELRTEIRKLHQRLSLTTVYVTHDQSEALSMADRIVVLNHSRVAQIGSPEEVYARPANAFVAAFMGYRNLLPVKVTSMRGPRALVQLAGTQFQATVAEDVNGSSACVAIRPEDIQLAGEDGPGVLDAKVEVSEYTGREFSVEATSTDGGTSWVFYSDVPLKPGDKVRLAVPAERLLLFDGSAIPAAAGKEEALT